MRMALADRLSAIVFFTLGVALLYGGWTMDRLEIRRIHPASIPGLVPMILGVLLSICAVLLYYTSYSKSKHTEEIILSGGSWARLGLSALICVVYALGLVGTLNYALATAIFTFTFTVVFSFPLNGDRVAQAKSVAGAVALGACVALGSSYMFRELFLVRLP